MSGINRYFTIGASTGQTLLHSGPGGRVGSLAIQFEFSGSPAANHSISIVGRNSRDGSGIDMSLLAHAYKNHATGAIATAAITANAKILVDASGCDIYADVTTVTTGSVRCTVTPLLG